VSKLDTILGLLHFYTLLLYQLLNPLYITVWVAFIYSTGCTSRFHNYVLLLLFANKDGMGENVARMGEMRNVHNVLVEKPERRRHLEDLGIDGKTI
jgi:hypothetical protein